MFLCFGGHFVILVLKWSRIGVSLRGLSGEAVGGIEGQGREGGC